MCQWRSCAISDYLSEIYIHKNTLKANSLPKTGDSKGNMSYSKKTKENNKTTTNNPSNSNSNITNVS